MFLGGPNTREGDCTWLHMTMAKVVFSCRAPRRGGCGLSVGAEPSRVLTATAARHGLYTLLTATALTWSHFSPKVRPSSSGVWFYVLNCAKERYRVPWARTDAGACCKA